MREMILPYLEHINKSIEIDQHHSYIGIAFGYAHKVEIVVFDIDISVTFFCEDWPLFSLLFFLQVQSKSVLATNKADDVRED